MLMEAPEPIRKHIMAGKSNYAPQIDSLRAIAITVVMLHHYLDNPFLLAGFGVVMFFLLSGYFATATLLRLRTKLEACDLRPKQALGAFYHGRYLRILPTFYLVLCGAALANVPNARDCFLWNATFLSNFWTLTHEAWPGRFSQLWSLGVLEQFYLFWPAAILFLPRRFLVPAALLGMIAAVGWKFGCATIPLSPFAWTVVPIAGLDQLCTGALLAICTADDAAPATRRRLLAVGRGCVGLFGAVLCARWFGVEAPHSAIYLPLIASLAFAWVVNRAREGFEGWTGKVLSSPLLVHCGRISFAAFLLHNLTSLLIPHSPHVREMMSCDLRCIVLVPVTFWLADILWRFYECPIRTLRKSGFALGELVRQPHLVYEAFAEPVRGVRLKLAEIAHAAYWMARGSEGRATP